MQPCGFCPNAIKGKISPVASRPLLEFQTLQELKSLNRHLIVLLYAPTWDAPSQMSRRLLAGPLLSVCQQ